MSAMRMPTVAALAALMIVSQTGFAAAQTPEPVPPAAQTPDQDQDVQADRPDMDRGDEMRDGRRGDRMRDRMRHGDRMRGGMMHRQMMKIMFAITDADNDGALSFEEISTIHKRIFDKVDANRDGKATPEEIQTYFHN
ncbi:calcium-binding protein [Sinorhizobium glycinis]|uniref:Calcium-binding protein n=1 Tax=Sinorhizobium glycinis TaxID=1472378 RepID=A0A178Y6S9_9HYPH|nr:EF-hand domain-containing protein [Sinorhizobium glycinis]OAP43278.1 calcium-binding protein [Sinorhizobium glycinis]